LSPINELIRQSAGAMLSEQDFDDLIQMDKADSRRHLILAGATVFVGFFIPAIPAIPGLLDSFGTIESYSRIAGLGTALLGALPAAKMMAIRKNVDRLNLIRGKWRRLKEMPGDTTEELSKIGELVWAACR
jgi:hypothetical protein